MSEHPLRLLAWARELHARLYSDGIIFHMVHGRDRTDEELASNREAVLVELERTHGRRPSMFEQKSRSEHVRTR